MKGRPVPVSWQGGLPFHYHFGDDFSVVVNVETETEFTNAPLWNVRAYLNGTTEPEKIVQLGNHRDAWM